MRTVVACLLVILATSAAGIGASAQEAAPGGVPQAAVERELLLRFSRAYGMARSVLEEHGVTEVSSDDEHKLLRNPEQLQQPLRDDVYEIIDQNRLDTDEWQAMFAQMEADPVLRERVESLSMPFGY